LLSRCGAFSYAFERHAFFIYHYKLNGIDCQEKTKKKTVLPRRVILSPGIEAYNDSARACAAFEYSCQ